MTNFPARLLAVLATLAAFPAAAFNHDTTVAPLASGRFTVACSNLEHDIQRLMEINSSVENFWEGNLDNGQSLYISQILAAPSTALRFGVPVPDDRSLYPQNARATIDHVAIACYPTPSGNPDPHYFLPSLLGIIPHMQRAGEAPRFIGTREYRAAYGFSHPDFAPDPPARLPLVLFSHGLGGSPVGGGHLDALVQMASHGYLVVAPFHADARFSRVRIADLGDFLYLVTQYDKFAEMQLMRPLALKTMTDLLLANPNYAAAIDTDRIAAFGASLGGQAVTNLVGAKLTTSVGLACRDTIQDARVKAVVALVPYSGQSFLPSYCDDQSGADYVARPVLSLAGTQDLTAPIKMTRQAVNRFGSSRFLVEMDIPHQYIAEYRGDIFTWMTAFLNGYLQLEVDPGAMGRFIKMQGVAGGPADVMTIDRHVPLPVAAAEGEVRTIEFYHPQLNHYFLAAGQDEIDILTNGPGGWVRTGHSFKAWSRLPADTFTAIAPVCRFYGRPAGGPNSHFFTASASECNIVKSNPGWYFEGIGFYARPVEAGGRCPAGWLAVNRAYNQGALRNDSNHRFVTSDSEWRLMQPQGWVLEGEVMCARP